MVESYHAFMICLLVPLHSSLAAGQEKAKKSKKKKRKECCLLWWYNNVLPESIDLMQVWGGWAALGDCDHRGLYLSFSVESRAVARYMFYCPEPTMQAARYTLVGTHGGDEVSKSYIWSGFTQGFGSKVTRIRIKIMCNVPHWQEILDQDIVNTCQAGRGLWINYFYLYCLLFFYLLTLTAKSQLS